MDEQEESAASGAYNYHQHRPLSNNHQLVHRHPRQPPLPPDSHQRPPMDSYELRRFVDCHQPPPYSLEMIQVPSTSTASFRRPPKAPRKLASMDQYQHARSQQFIPPLQRSPSSVIRHTTKAHFQRAIPPQLPPEAVSKSMSMSVQNAIGISSQATPEAVPGPRLVSIEQEVGHACEPVPVGFQSTQESLAVLKTEQEMDVVQPEAERNPPAVGEVSGQNMILDPNVEKVISDGLVLRPRKVKRQYIRTAKPKVPMQDSTLLNIESKQDERMKIKKAPKGGKGAPKTAAVVKSPEVNVKVIPTKFTKPAYSEQEKDFLYADGKFVIRVADLDLSPDSIHIWRICKAEKYLLQFYPCRHAEQQYFQTSAVTWYFTDEDFTSDEFYDSFQPIIVVVANSRTLGEEDPSKFCPLTRMDLTIVQYVHSVEKGFIQRMAKYIGKIDKTEAWQPIFMSALPIVTLLVFNETLVSDERIVPGYGEHREHYLQLQSQTKALLDRVANKFYKNAFDQLCEYPELQFKYDVDKTASCGACLDRRRPRAPYARVIFDGSAVDKVPYNPDSFRSLPSAKTKKFPENVFWCEACSLSLQKIHRLAHYWYHLWRLSKQNVLNDIEHFLSMDVQPTDERIVWTQSINIPWKNIMFANFQLTYAEVEEELC